MLTPDRLKAFVTERDALNEALEHLARALYIFRLDEPVKPKDQRLDTVVYGYLESWELDEARGDKPETVDVKFYVSGSYGYQDWAEVSFPLSYLAPVAEGADPAWLAPETAARDAKRTAAAKRRDEARRAAEAEDRATLAKLQAQYPDA
ncbi:hypothetical protein PAPPERLAPAPP_01090 [Brevundimonas phage vB_BpoS-Papperlapapp]|uniref:Uncharacterized protein n=1 Tax=Brevundimonas phage vB_BpoS-Domovoi TaxID=2948598 RepID=A0A9E7MPX8_9CAUD|nr:hypothetical protein DOMOVOI_00030 [Brevundimonas phage vB_BpoS-Domovoi]USN15851.1 hypothetical protein PAPPERLAPAPP_01090 [Brevundimonas phage vB_BpoS-Papperlapapp]